MTMMKVGRRFAGAGVAVSAVMLSGCAGLPSSGPTAREITAQAAPRKGVTQFNVVNLDRASVDALNTVAPPSLAKGLGALGEGMPDGAIGPGDILTINLYEVGVSLFSGSHATAAGADSFDASAHGEEFASVAVDRNGDIRLPFAGTLHVEGEAPEQVEHDVEARLADKSQHPQVVVGVKQAMFSTVVITGDVRKPGRVALTPGHERLTDAVAAVGGTEASANDIVVRVVRNGHRAEQRLGDIDAGSPDDLVLSPGDRIDVVRSPRSFTAFGATGHVSEVSFDGPRLSLAEAIARAGGPNDAAADPTAIFLFRLDAPLGANGLPNIYRISMMNVQTYFLAQKVAMQNKDLIYIANARSNQPSKFVAIINQLFSPAVAVRAISQ